MQTFFEQEINKAFGPTLPSKIVVNYLGKADLRSCFGVSDFATASIKSAATELAEFVNAENVTIDRRLSSLWFGMTLKPESWELPSAWDAIAGVYKAKDGWIRLHTNAPHHKNAALHVLGCPEDKVAVSDAVKTWQKATLEAAIVAEHGAAATMLSAKEWISHPQGRAVNAEPLIHWTKKAEGAKPCSMSGLKVLDLTRVLAGPVATRFLAGFGAQVLRVDPPSWNEPGVEPEVTLGKRRAGLDLSKAQDRSSLDDLIRKADVLVHGYRPGALAGLGYDPEHLKALAPHMIEVSLSAYGWTGPWAKRRGFDSLVQMSCGIAAEGMHRLNATRPVPLPVQALDHATGYLMAAAVLRALRIRQRTGAIFSARLSLARTAALLMAPGSRNFRGSAVEETPQDLDDTPETTAWGVAKRIKFPVTIDGKTAQWPYPAGPLRVDSASWS
ncbi:MAG: CoA transferase [Pseudomonadota bacterium]